MIVGVGLQKQNSEERTKHFARLTLCRGVMAMWGLVGGVGVRFGVG